MNEQVIQGEENRRFHLEDWMLFEAEHSWLKNSKVELYLVWWKFHNLIEYSEKNGRVLENGEIYNGQTVS